MKQTLGQRLRALRIEKGYKQTYVAQQLNIENYNLSNYESDRREPSPEVLKKLADFYQVSVSYLLFGEDKNDNCYRDIIDILTKDNISYQDIPLSDYERETLQRIVVDFLDALRNQKRDE